MSLDYSYDVGYGFVIRPEHTGIIEALTEDFGEDELPILDFGLADEKFKEEYPLLTYGTSGNDGQDVNLVIMLAGSHRNLEAKYNDTVGAFELRDRDLSDEELMQLVTFAGKYNIPGTPSWVAYTAIH